MNYFKHYFKYNNPGMFCERTIVKYLNFQENEYKIEEENDLTVAHIPFATSITDRSSLVTMNTSSVFGMIYYVFVVIVNHCTTNLHDNSPKLIALEITFLDMFHGNSLLFFNL